MARQIGTQLTGTMGGITYYKMDGIYYARAHTSLDKKKVMKDKAFERSRVRMKDFGAASRWCSPIYRQLPKSCKGQGVHQKMTGRAHRLFLEGKSGEEVRELLLKVFGN